MKDIHDSVEHARRRRRWLPDETPPEGQRASLFRLATAMRSTIELMMDSDAPPDVLDDAAEQIKRIAARLEAGPRGRALWGWAESSNSGDTKADFDNSPLIGPANPIAPPLKLKVEPDQVLATAYYGRQYEGPPEHVHGGIVASSFDDFLGTVQSLTGKSGVTGRLTVHYRNPTPLFRNVQFRGWVDRVEGRKVFTLATLHDGDTLCAEAEGLFITVNFSRFHELAAARNAEHEA